MKRDFSMLRENWSLTCMKSKNKNDTLLGVITFYGGGHGTRTHGAVTPYRISNAAP